VTMFSGKRFIPAQQVFGKLLGIPEPWSLEQGGMGSRLPIVDDKIVARTGGSLERVHSRCSLQDLHPAACVVLQAVSVRYQFVTLWSYTRQPNAAPTSRDHTDLAPD
jgi:hypothetical protein